MSMVKPINLLPLSYRDEARKKMVLPFIVLFGLLGLFCAGSMYLVVQDEVNSLSESRGEIKSSDSPNSAKVTVNYQDTINSINALNTVSKKEVDWNKVFASVGSLTPKDITLSNVTVSGITTSAGSISIKVTGDAPSNASFAAYIDSLNSASSGVSGLKIDSYAYNAANGRVAFGTTLQLSTQGLLYQSQKTNTSGGVK